MFLQLEQTSMSEIRIKLLLQGQCLLSCVTEGQPSSFENARLWIWRCCFSSPLQFSGKQMLPGVRGEELANTGG